MAYILEIWSVYLLRTNATESTSNTVVNVLNQELLFFNYES